VTVTVCRGAVALITTWEGLAVRTRVPDVPLMLTGIETAENPEAISGVIRTLALVPATAPGEAVSDKGAPAGGTLANPSVEIWDPFSVTVSAPPGFTVTVTGTFSATEGVIVIV
jgi:hypothetical protein